MPARVGHVYRDAAFYVDPDSGELKPKFLLVLAAPEHGDIVFRMLTTRYASHRPEVPPCSHEDPYAGFFLGVLGGELDRKSWLDLRHTADLDPWSFARHRGNQRIREVLVLPLDLLRPALACAAAADDTTRQQERLIRDAMATLPG